MSDHPIHPNWTRSPDGMCDGYSLEMTAKDRPSLAKAAPQIAPETPVAVTFLPGEDMDARIAAATDVRKLGFEPMPHISARRIESQEELEKMVSRAVEEAGSRRFFAIAGDPPVPAGPFSETMDLIKTGVFENAGVAAIGIAGHPEGHPNMTVDECWAVLEAKCAEIEKRGMAPLIVTQFGFDADPFLDWLTELRKRGMNAPVRIGVPGPAGIKRLLSFAARCGVGASASVMTKYGLSITNLLGSAGPDKLVNALRDGLNDTHGPVRLHFYPFGGLERTVEWINDYKG